MPPQPLDVEDASPLAEGTRGRRGWLSSALAAVAVSALGLAVAGAMPLSTSAETRAAGVRAVHTNSQPSGSTDPTARQPSPTTRSVTASGSLGSFAPRGAAVASDPPLEPTNADRSDTLVRAAVLKERAAQRAEALAAATEGASRASRSASQQVRARQLATADRDARVTAVQIATERRRRAIAARVAAE